jgi:organic hydroperoxide reductase OsmC/OhrA
MGSTDTAIRLKPRSALIYSATLTWDGNLGSGTSDYASYGRSYRITIPGKPELAGSADPAFRGEPDVHNPEEFLLASVSACHMLFYLALCSSGGVAVLSYEDEPSGKLALQPDGGGRFEEIVLRPQVALAEGADEALARRLHEVAHQRCFIANSCNFPIRLDPTIALPGSGRAVTRTAKAES